MVGWVTGGKFVTINHSPALKRTTINQILCGYFSVSKLIIIQGKHFICIQIYNYAKIMLLFFFNFQIYLTCKIMDYTVPDCLVFLIKKHVRTCCHMTTERMDTLHKHGRISIFSLFQ